MASRFWISGTGTWNGSNTTNWSATSGGSSGASFPTSADDVFFDSNSGSGTVTISASSCRNLTLTGYAGNFTGGNVVQVFGPTITLGATNTNINIRTSSTSTAISLLSSSAQVASFEVSGAGNVITLTGNLTCKSSITGVAFTMTSGTFNANGYDVTTYNVFPNGGGILNMGSGTWTLTGDTDNNGISIWGATGVTVNPSTSTIKILENSSAGRTFDGAGKTYNNIWISGSGTGTIIFTGSNTFNEFKDDGSIAHILKFTAGTTMAVSTFTVSGTSGHLISLVSSSNGSPWTISSAGPLISRDFLSIQDSSATGGAYWFAGANSTNVSGNTGWVFTGIPTASKQTQGFFLMANVPLLATT